jgi:WD40 repeat protein
MRRLTARFVNYVFGDDVFISYTRADAVTYAAGLANQLAAKDFSCFLDQWGTPPGKELPDPLKRALRRSAAFVLVGTEKATESAAVGQEIAEFVKTRRPIIPIDFGGALERAAWSGLIVGLARTPESAEALRMGDPSPVVVSRIEKTCAFTRRNQRVRRTFSTAAVLLLALTGVSSYKACEATSLALAAKSLADLPRDPEESVRSASSAWRAWRTAAAEEALWKSLLESNVHAVVPGRAARVTPAAFSGDGRHVVLPGETGNTIVLSLADRRVAATLRGHAGAVKTAEFSPDGRLIVTGGDDKTARVWAWESGAAPVTLTGHTEPVTDAAFSTDGRLVVTTAEGNPPLTCHQNLVSYGQPTAEDTTARLWDAIGGTSLPPALTGRCVRTGRGPGSLARALSLGARFVVFAGDAPAFLARSQVWDVSNGRVLVDLQEPGVIAQASVDRAGALMATLDSHGAIHLWDLRTGRRLAELDQPGSRAAATTTSLALSPDGKYLVTGQENFNARVWTLSPGREDKDTWKTELTRELYGHTGPIRSVATSSDGTFLLTGSDDTTARVWEADTGKLAAVLRGHTGPVRSTAFSPDGRFMLTSSLDGTARVWRATMGQPQAELTVPTSTATHVETSAGSNVVATTGEDGVVRLWDARSGQKLAAEATGYRVALAPGGAVAAIAAPDHVARVYEAATGRRRCELRGHRGRINSAVFSPDGTSILTADEDGTARVWDAKTGSERLVLGNEDGTAERARPLLAAAFSPDGARIVTAGSEVRVWTTGAEPPRIFATAQGMPWARATFSPDGTRILGVPDHGPAARVWDVASGQVWVEGPRHRQEITAAAFSPDGKVVATLDVYGLRIWPVPAPGQPPRKLDGDLDRAPETRPLRNLAFSPDSQLLLAVGAGAQVLDVSNPLEPTLLARLTSRVALRAGAFSPDGKSVVTTGDDRTARIWDPRTGQERLLIDGNGKAGTGAAFAGGGALLCTWGEDASNATRIWRADGGVLADLAGILGAVSQDGQALVTMGRGDRAWLWGTRDDHAMAELEGVTGGVTRLGFGPDGRVVAGSTEDGTVTVWDVATGKALATMHQEGKDLAFVFSPDGTILAVTVDDGPVRLWEWRTTRAPIETPSSRRAVFRPDGRFLATIAGDKPSLCELSSRSGAAPRCVELSGHTEAVNDARFSEDSRWLATASDDMTARLWDATSGAFLREYRGHAERVNSVAFSPEGRFVVTASYDGTARVWETLTGRTVVELLGHHGGVLRAAFTPDGQTILTETDRTIRIYGCPPCGSTRELYDRARNPRSAQVAR